MSILNKCHDVSLTSLFNLTIPSDNNYSTAQKVSYPRLALRESVARYRICVVCYSNRVAHDEEKISSSLGLDSSAVVIGLFNSLSKLSFSVYSYPGFVYININFTTICRKYSQTQTFL